VGTAAGRYYGALKENKMIIGKRLILEEVDPANIEQLRQWRNDPDLRKYFREFKDISKDQQDGWYKERGNNSNPEHIYFQIMERRLDEQGQPIGLERDLVGCCGLHYVDWRLRATEFGIFLAKSQGKGFGEEALFLMFDYGFRECNFDKIWGEVYDFNGALGLYKKIGMTEEGRIRHSQFTNGKYCGSVILSVLQEEWFEKYGVDEIKKQASPWK
jgi:RimJ/RimL family protein N-acetyltransferase